MTSSGIVRAYHPEEGWGVLDGPDVPGGCWVHFSAIAIDGYRELTAGQRVSFRAEPASQDGFAHRAVRVWTDDVEPPDLGQDDVRSVAYRSSLTLIFDEPPSEGRR